MSSSRYKAHGRGETAALSALPLVKKRLSQQGSQQGKYEGQVKAGLSVVMVELFIVREAVIELGMVYGDKCAVHQSNATFRGTRWIDWSREAGRKQQRSSSIRVGIVQYSTTTTTATQGGPLRIHRRWVLGVARESKCRCFLEVARQVEQLLSAKRD